MPRRNAKERRKAYRGPVIGAYNKRVTKKMIEASLERQFKGSKPAERRFAQFEGGFDKGWKEC